MNNLAVKEVNFNGDTLIAAQDQATEKVYVAVRWVCEWIGLTDGQMRNERKRIRDDPLLKNGCTKDYFSTNGGKQLLTLLEIEYLPIWLSKINIKSLNHKQYQNIIKLINYTVSADFNRLKVPLRTYQWEGELRDEIYNKGYFRNYKIIDKEVSYSFGRVDLLAKDENNGLVVIELKKHKNYNDVLAQCRKYITGFKNEFNKSIKIIICTLDNDETFLKNAKTNGFDVYKYERKLELHKIS